LRPPAAVARFLLHEERLEKPMHMNVVMIQPLVALLFGILILILPRLLNYLIAIYLIVIGLVGLFPNLFTTTV
jgi:glucan phosphoethanolaminetransferase (alkaline phosphatase superfamily)